MKEKEKKKNYIPKQRKVDTQEKQNKTKHFYQIYNFTLGFVGLI